MYAAPARGAPPRPLPACESSDWLQTVACRGRWEVLLLVLHGGRIKLHERTVASWENKVESETGHVTSQ